MRFRSLFLLAISGAGLWLAAGAPLRAQTSDTGARAAPLSQEDERGPRPARGRARQAGDARTSDNPLYGNPPAFGAGGTGFDSTNALRRKARARVKQKPGHRAELPPGGPRAVLPSVTNPPAGGMILPSRFLRHGAPASLTTSAFNVPSTVLMPRRPLLAAVDPFEAPGIRAGAFLLRPAIDFTTGHDTNPAHTNVTRGSDLIVVAPELLARSDWQRHALNADLRGSYSSFNNTFDPEAPQSLDRPFVDAKVQGRIDVSSLSKLDLEGRLLVTTDNPGSPNIQVGLRRFPIVTTTGGTVGYTQRFNRFEIAVKGSIDRSAYQPSTLIDGTVSSNDDRDFDQYAGAVRASYDLLPGVKPFVETGADTRVHDLPVDRTGARRDSDGRYAKAGSTFDVMRSLTGEFSLGYLARTYVDPSLPDLAGFTADAALIWTATPLTTFTATARTAADETIVAGISGTFRRDFGLQVDHAFRRWLIGTARIGYGIDDYIGSERFDYRHSVSLGLLYKASRYLYFKGEVRRDWMRSTVTGVDWDANVVLVGVRVQR